MLMQPVSSLAFLRFFTTPRNAKRFSSHEEKPSLKRRATRKVTPKVIMPLSPSNFWVSCTERSTLLFLRHFPCPASLGFDVVASEVSFCSFAFARSFSSKNVSWDFERLRGSLLSCDELPKRAEDDIAGCMGRFEKRDLCSS